MDAPMPKDAEPTDTAPKGTAKSIHTAVPMDPAMPRPAPGYLVIAAVASALLVGGLVLAYVQRDTPSPVLAVAVLLAGSVLALAAAAWGVATSRAPRGLHLPDGGDGGWPVFPWWWLAGATGAVDLLAGPLVSGWLGLLGIVLIAMALVGLGLDLRSPDRVLDRDVVSAARRLRRAVDAGPDSASGSGQAAVLPLGTRGARVTHFDARGRLIDAVLPDTERAAMAARVAGLTPVAVSDLHPPTQGGSGR